MGKELPSPDVWTPVKVVGPGEQFGSGTLEAPEDDQGGHVEAGKFRKAGRCLGVLGLTAALGLFISGHSENDNSTSGNMDDTCRRVAVQDGPQHYYDGDGTLVGIGASKRDRQAVQGTLEKLGRGGDLEYTAYGTTTLDPEQATVIEPGVIDVCVGRNGVSITSAPPQESLPALEETAVKNATILSDTAAEFNMSLPAMPKGE